MTLRISADEYRRVHELPAGTIRSLQSRQRRRGQTTRRRGFARLGAGPAVLRDYVKSMKHYWHEAAYIPDVADTAAAWKRRAARYGSSMRTSSLSARLEQFASAEVRMRWSGGTCRLVPAHPDTPGQLPSADLSLDAVASLVGSLALPFVTADLGPSRRRVLEGHRGRDGQVS